MDSVSKAITKPRTGLKTILMRDRKLLVGLGRVDKVLPVTDKTQRTPMDQLLRAKTRPISILNIKRISNLVVKA